MFSENFSSLDLYKLNQEYLSIRNITCKPSWQKKSAANRISQTKNTRIPKITKYSIHFHWLSFLSN